MFRRMLSDPDPMKTLFMNGKSRRYQKDPSSGDWTLINDWSVKIKTLSNLCYSAIAIDFHKSFLIKT